MPQPCLQRMHGAIPPQVHCECSYALNVLIAVKPSFLHRREGCFCVEGYASPAEEIPSLASTHLLHRFEVYFLQLPSLVLLLLFPIMAGMPTSDEVGWQPVQATHARRGRLTLSA